MSAFPTLPMQGLYTSDCTQLFMWVLGIKLTSSCLFGLSFFPLSPKCVVVFLMENVGHKKSALAKLAVEQTATDLG